MIAVIGDVHGCFYTLQNLVEKISQKYPEIPIYCVGDLVDRGNHSFEVFEYVISKKIIFTPGNHDYMFYSSLRDPGSLMGRSWRFNGAETTLASYKDKLDQMNEHLDLIISSPLFINSEDGFISHAGISLYYKDKLPKDYLSKPTEFEEILKKDLFDENSIIWSRGELLNIGKLQIIGHTHRKEVFHNKDSNVLYIDTTAYGNNKLTAVIVEENNLLDTLDENTHPEDINRNWSIYS
jgi:serine/threonine protein phosphatase 1